MARADQLMIRLQPRSTWDTVSLTAYDVVERTKAVNPGAADASASSRWLTGCWLCSSRVSGNKWSTKFQTSKLPGAPGIRVSLARLSAFRTITLIRWARVWYCNRMNSWPKARGTHTELFLWPHVSWELTLCRRWEGRKKWEELRREQISSYEL